VVALGLAVDQHVQPELLLFTDGALDLPAHPRLVPLAVDLTGAKLPPHLADLRRLRKRPDGGGRKLRQDQGAGLQGRAFGVSRPALAEARRQLLDGRLNGWGVYPLRGAATRQRSGVLAQRLRHRAAPLVQRRSEQPQLLELLLRERQPRP